MTTTTIFSPARLKQARIRLGMSQAELARKARIGERQISRWEGGKNEPSLASLGALADALTCTFSEFFETSESGADDDEEESELLQAAHALDRAGHYGLADGLRRRARSIARRVVV